MEHTKEPWKVVNRGDDECSDIDAKGPEGWGGDVTVATNIGNTNARRIVACVNACAGISNENLEDNLPVKELARRYNDALKRRDELLAACLEAEDYYPSEAAPPYMAAIRAATASTKGAQP